MQERADLAGRVLNKVDRLTLDEPRLKCGGRITIAAVVPPRLKAGLGDLEPAEDPLLAAVVPPARGGLRDDCDRSLRGNLLRGIARARRGGGERERSSGGESVVVRCILGLPPCVCAARGGVGGCGVAVCVCGT